MVTTYAAGWEDWSGAEAAPQRSSTGRERGADDGGGWHRDTGSAHVAPGLPVFTTVATSSRSVIARWASAGAGRWDVQLVDRYAEPLQGAVVDEPCVVFDELDSDTCYGLRVCGINADSQRSPYSILWWARTKHASDLPGPDAG